MKFNTTTSVEVWCCSSCSAHHQLRVLCDIRQWHDSHPIGWYTGHNNSLSSWPAGKLSHLPSYYWINQMSNRVPNPQWTCVAPAMYQVACLSLYICYSQIGWSNSFRALVHQPDDLLFRSQYVALSLPKWIGDLTHPMWRSAIQRDHSSSLEDGLLTIA